MESLTIKVINQVGLHARPAASFVKKAQSFASQILIENVSKRSEKVNAKSFVKILSIAVDHDNDIRITADGDDAVQAIQGLKELVDANFGE
ncbi:MAG: HPr family phosphocarrier protein [Anaerolineaceae bacterium]